MRTAVVFAMLIASSALLTPDEANSQSPAPTLVTPTQSTAATGNDQRIVPRGNEKPSFDCAQAKTAAARLICADAELARLDGGLGAAFQRRKAQLSAPDQSKFVTEQLAWIRDRNARCDLVGKNGAPIEVLVGSKSCLISLIRERIAFLAQTDSTGSANIAPQRPPIPSVEPLRPDALIAAAGNTGTTVPALKWVNAGEDGVCLYPQPQCVVVPAEQRELSSILSRFNVLDQNAPNDIQREKLEPAFRKEFCAKIPQGDVSGWIGEVRTIDNRTPSKGINLTLYVDTLPTQHGRFGIELTLGNGYAYGVNADNTQPHSPTVIAVGSPLYEAVSNLAEGDTVVFNGTFIPYTSAQACYDNDTTHFSLFRFSRIQKIGHRIGRSTGSK